MSKVHFDAMGHSNPFCGSKGYALETTRDENNITCKRCKKLLIHRKMARKYAEWLKEQKGRE